MKKILKNYKMFNVDPYSLRGKHFFSEIFEYREKIFKERIDLIVDEYYCFLCGEKINIKPEIPSIQKYTISQCDCCGLYSPNINPSENIVYNNSYYGKKQISAIENHYDYRKKIMGKERFEYVKSFSNKKSSNLKILDVGCGAGYFIDYACDYVEKIVGTEVSERLINRAKKRNLNVVKLEEVGDIFDIITMFDVLEHLESPVDFFKSLRSRLDENGIIVAYTPNIESIAYYLMGEKQNTLLPFEHYCFFNTQSLNYLCSHSGYKIINIDYYGWDLMDYLLLKEHEDGISYCEKLQELIPSLQTIIDKQQISNHMRVVFGKTTI
jgi:SAM-dependent methyltransferase